MKTFKLIDGTGSGESKLIEAEDLEAAKTEAEEWMRECDWTEDGKTAWVSVHLIDLADVPPGDAPWDHKVTLDVTIEPVEPACSHEDGHDWQSPFDLVGGIKENPGVWGHGGGVVIHEACLHCGCGRVTDTWAQDPSNGRQGLRSVEYHPDRYQIPEASA